MAGPDVDDRARSGAQSVERAIRVLRTIADAGADLGVSELAQRTALSVSTTHRLLRVLLAAGLVDQDPRTERYQLGPMLVPLGRAAEQRLGFARVRPVLESLASTTGESVNLGVRVGDDVLVVVDVASSQPLRFDQAPGSRVPIHTSAMGKCLLAWDADPAGAVDRLGRLVAVTDRTITEPGALRAELDRVRRQGWALNDEERVPGVRAVAVPVLDAAGVALAAIAVQAPALRLADDRLDEVVHHLRTATRDVRPFLTTL